eukprot:tig00000147_g9476.t1
MATSDVGIASTTEPTGLLALPDEILEKTFEYFFAMFYTPASLDDNYQCERKCACTWPEPRSLAHECKVIAAAYRLHRHLRLAPARSVARVTRVNLGQLRQTRPQHVHKVLRALAEAEAAAEPRLTHLSLAFVELEVLDLSGCRMASGRVRVLPAILESCKGTLRRLYLAYLETESGMGALLCSGRPLITSLPALDGLDVSGCEACRAAFLDARARLALLAMGNPSQRSDVAAFAAARASTWRGACLRWALAGPWLHPSSARACG